MTTRLTTLLGCLLAVAACGDDGGNNNNDVCGDGQTTGNEQCDDGNTAGGDGCSASCRNESSGPVCGDGVMSGTEECDDSNTTSGDGCSSQCQTEGGADCGNGAIDGTEDCDDGNSTNNDGCTGCNVDNGWTCNNAEPSVCTQTTTTPNGSCQAPFEIALTVDAEGDLGGTATGDTSTGTSTVGSAPCDDIDGGLGKELVYKFTLPDTRDVGIRLLAPNFATDPIVRILSTPCTLSTEIPELNGFDGCSTVDEDGDAIFIYSALTAGTYYVLVDGVAAGDAGAFEIRIGATPTTCGDGVLDGFTELCDDGAMAVGDGCNARCDVEPGYVCDTDVDPSVCVLSCGNGFVDGTDECDDDNAASGDGCSSTCALEYDVLEVENNNTTPQTITAVNHVIKGSFAEDDVDLYTFTLTAPAKVEIETYVTIDASVTYGGAGNNTAYDCGEGEDILADTVVNIFPMGADVTMNAQAIFGDDDDGDQLCSYLGPNDTADDDVTDDVADPTEGTLPAGTYTFKVVELDGFEVPTYMINFRIIQAPVAASLAINEYMAEDGVFDTNCDTLGTTAGNTDDEFVEIVNKLDVSVDLAGVTVNDAVGVRHTFTVNNEGPGSLILDPKKSIVVWGGGEPECPGVTNWFVASSNSLALNNDAAESITLRTAGGVSIATVAFTATTAGVSNNLDVDITGATYMLHDAVTGHVGNFTPGKRVNNTPF